MINTSIYTLISSELNNRGYSEFKKGNMLADNNYITKILRYDKEVENIVNEKFFQGLQLDDIENDRIFKRHFLNRFLNHSISGQTMELFSSQLCFTFLNNIIFLNEYYNNLEDYITNKSISVSTGKDNQVSDNRIANSTLPQNQVNIDVDNSILGYADDNTISRQQNKSDTNKSDENKTFNMDNLINSRTILNDVFLEFENNCFLKVW